MTDTTVMSGCEPFSHVGTRSSGVLVLHGFTGNPSSMRYQARALAEAGHHVEQPLLPGHGTSVDDMLATGWGDWSGAARQAFDRLAERVERVVVMGLSMGGTLTLWTALDRIGDERLRGIVCVNPLTQRQPDDVIEMLEEMVEDGFHLLPSIGADIADPDEVEIAYESAPVVPLLSLHQDGVGSITDRYGDAEVPLLLFTAHEDHVVPPENSVHLAGTYGGEVDHVWLERSYHVATQDHDRDLIVERTLAFVERVAG